MLAERDQLPQVLGNVLDMALDVDAITQAVSQGTSSLASVLEEAVIGPAVLGFVSVLLFTVCFALLGGLVRLLTSAIHFVFHSPILLPIPDCSAVSITPFPCKRYPSIVVFLAIIP